MQLQSRIIIRIIYAIVLANHHYTEYVKLTHVEVMRRMMKTIKCEHCTFTMIKYEKMLHYW